MKTIKRGILDRNGIEFREGGGDVGPDADRSNSNFEFINHKEILRHLNADNGRRNQESGIIAQ